MTLKLHQLVVGPTPDIALTEALSATCDASPPMIVTGGNGVGKTTLLETLAGLRLPVSGAIERTNIEKIFYMGHQAGLPPECPVAQAWKMLTDSAWSDVVTDAVPLLNGILGQTQTDRLSAGQKKRVRLAALMHCLAHGSAHNTPAYDLVILDEIEANLDFLALENLIHFLSSLSQRLDITMIISTHSAHTLLKQAFGKTQHCHLEATMPEAHERYRA